MPLASHIQLPERYRVTRHIASGGMASVWEVEDLLLGRGVAGKVLGANYAAHRGGPPPLPRAAPTTPPIAAPAPASRARRAPPHAPATTRTSRRSTTSASTPRTRSSSW